MAIVRLKQCNGSLQDDVNLLSEKAEKLQKLVHSLQTNLQDKEAMQVIDEGMCSPFPMDLSIFSFKHVGFLGTTRGLGRQAEQGFWQVACKCCTAGL